MKEIVEAREYRSDMIKLFPFSTFKYLIIKDIKDLIKCFGNRGNFIEDNTNIKLKNLP